MLILIRIIRLFDLFTIETQGCSKTLKHQNGLMDRQRNELKGLLLHDAALT
jgi:hypothetical protein